jgi:hypothetical protein
MQPASPRKERIKDHRRRILVSVFPDEGESLEDLIKKTDRATYAAGWSMQKRWTDIFHFIKVLIA